MGLIAYNIPRLGRLVVRQPDWADYDRLVRSWDKPDNVADEGLIRALVQTIDGVPLADGPLPFKPRQQQAVGAIVFKLVSPDRDLGEAAIKTATGENEVTFLAPSGAEVVFTVPTVAAVREAQAKVADEVAELNLMRKSLKSVNGAPWSPLVPWPLDLTDSHAYRAVFHDTLNVTADEMETIIASGVPVEG